jgi:glycosyltransferase involved in cell wall biosynthesis
MINTKKVKKIIIVSLNSDDNSGGVERVVYYLNRILSEQYDVSILKRTVSFGGFDKIIYPFLFSLQLLFIKNTVVISNSWQSFLFPVDFSIHHGTTAGYMRNDGIKSRKSAVLAWMEKISAQKAKRILAVSRVCKKELEDMYNVESDKITVLNNFVDERLFYPEGTQGHKTPNVIRILFSGRLEERKGLSRLLALAEVLQHTPDYELHLALNSTRNCELFEDRANIYLYKNLTIPEMRLFYSNGDILYFPSLYEGFSMVTLEAMACGLPVIGTTHAVPEELRKYQFTCLYEKNDAAPLLNHIKILYDKFHTQKNEIHSIIARDFGYEQYKSKLLSLIQKTAK